jgi:predicted transcriptional regulator
MERRNFNELKEQVLKLLEDQDGLTSRDVRLSVHGERTNICDVLYRLNHQKLVDRESLPREAPGRPIYVYSLSQRGKDRLDYWKSKAPLPSIKRNT